MWCGRLDGILEQKQGIREKMSEIQGQASSAPDGTEPALTS